jgi:dTDP-4-dehydrorhamnose reductase
VNVASKIAVTGARGRLGRALVSVLDDSRRPAIGLTRPDYDLDDPGAAERVVKRDGPNLVLHAAAWTDVDGCARDPGLAERRNGQAVREMARACAAAGARMVLVSTNEVFDGERDDGVGYTESDAVNPINPYGVSKLSGELAAREEFDAAGAAGNLWIVRTAWLYGPPGADFPTKILAAADRLETGQPLRVVSDEVGSATFTTDLAGAIVALVSYAPGGLYHVANVGAASRYDVAREVLQRCRRGTPIAKISKSEFSRASTPPAWSVLDSSAAAGFGVTMRDWRSALADYLHDVCTG